MAGEIFYDELRPLYDKNAICIIDVRDRDEIEKQGRIPGTINIPLTALKRSINDCVGTISLGNNKLDWSKPVVFMGLSVRKAHLAYELVSKKGFAQARMYGGGLNDWEKHGGPVEAVKKQ